MRIAGSKALHGPLYDGLGRIDIGIADTENDHILAPIARRRCFPMRSPGIGAFAANAIYQWRKFHSRDFT